MAATSQPRARFQVRIEARHRHHALGVLYDIDILRAAPDGLGQCRLAHAAHSELATAVTTALASVAGALARQATHAARPAGEVVDGHITRLSKPEGTGAFTTASGAEISFTRDDLENDGFADLRMGDRVWWIMRPDGGGRLHCMSRNKLGRPEPPPSNHPDEDHAKPASPGSEHCSRH